MSNVSILTRSWLRWQWVLTSETFKSERFLLFQFSVIWKHFLLCTCVKHLCGCLWTYPVAFVKNDCVCVSVYTGKYHQRRLHRDGNLSIHFPTCLRFLEGRLGFQLCYLRGVWWSGPDNRGEQREENFLKIKHGCSFCYLTLSVVIVTGFF